MELTAGENDQGRRLDRILRKALPDHPLALIHRLLRRKQVFVNGKPAKAQDRIESGVTISIPSMRESLKRCQAPNSSNWRLTPIWQDKGLIAFNKPAGLAVHGHDSLDTMVRSFLADKLPPSLSFTPGPLHRLDKPSSGIVVFSASLDGARLFTSLMREHKIKKTYLAITEGVILKSETWENKLIRDHEKKKTFDSGSPSAKTAVTKITPLASKKNFSLIQAEIITGRTHQIRAQAAFHGHPLLGDIKYGALFSGQPAINKKQAAQFFLHARILEFLDYRIEAPLPEAFAKKVKDVFGEETLAETLKR